MLGAGLPGSAEPVGALDEEEAEYAEEDAGDFEPEDAAGVSEGAPDRFAEALCAAFCSGGGSDSARRVRRGFFTGGLGGTRGAVAEHS